MVDSVFRTRSLGVPAAGIPDQYADGRAAKVWEAYIGSSQQRTAQYKDWLTGILKNNNCQTVLDVACGHGVDSMLLLDSGFTVVSTDASDKMLKYALRQRWQHRKQQQYDDWVIEEANWLSLPEDLAELESVTVGQFDAVICLGNSFAHMPDFEGDQRNQRAALSNFKKMLKPGGLLLIDHRNYDEILATGLVPAKNVYYNSTDILGIKCSNLYVDGKPHMITMDYYLDVASISKHTNIKLDTSDREHHFRLSYYPHRLSEFKSVVRAVFGEAASYSVFGDFKPVGEATAPPAYYIHVIRTQHAPDTLDTNNV